MRGRLWCGLLIAAALLSSKICAIGDAVVILGQGNQSCGSWLQNRAMQSLPEVTQEAWVVGYITALNNYAQSGDLTRGTDTDGLFRWIDAYCQTNPLDNLFRATNALIRELEKRVR